MNHSLGHHSQEAEGRENAAFMELEARHAARLASRPRVALEDVGFRCRCGITVLGQHGPQWDQKRCSACLGKRAA